MKNVKEKTIVFITGASGTGKTTLVDRMKKKYAASDWLFLHFDSVGVPSADEMRQLYGSPSAWQEAKTNEWIERLVNIYDNQKIFLEGQVNLQFIRAGFQKYNFENYKIVLIDCSEDEMFHRLAYKRRQPELFSDSMKNWLRYLRNQAIELKVPVIDTSNLSKKEVIEEFEKTIGICGTAGGLF